jgi:hypothetical protein
LPANGVASGLADRDRPTRKYIATTRRRTTITTTTTVVGLI